MITGTIKCECGQELSNKARENDRDNFAYFVKLNGWTVDKICIDIKSDEGTAITEILMTGRCPVCTGVVKLCEIIKAVDLMRFPIWKEIKELVLDDLDYEEVFDRSVEFEEFLHEAKDKNMLNKFLTNAAYSDVKEWLKGQETYLLPQAKGQIVHACRGCGKNLLIPEEMRGARVFCDKGCFEKAAHDHMIERTD